MNKYVAACVKGKKQQNTEVRDDGGSGMSE